MKTARELAIGAPGDTFQERMDKITSLFEGDTLVARALGEDYYIDQTIGELMAQNDYDRNETASGWASWILDALRFARADSSKFQGFVEGLRTKAEQPEKVNREMSNTLKGYLPRN